MGPRQCGKTTLVKSLIDDAWEYITLDDRAQLETARADPVGFVRNLHPRRIALDEVQRVPELFVSIKQAEWIEEPLSFHHYRDKDQVEVDVIIENASGDCFGVEVKAGATLTAKDFAGLRRLRSVAGRRFKLGVLLYDGDHTTAFGDHLFAVPIGALWS